MRLVVNADDLGMSDAVNAAIEACLEAGCVTSVSLLAHGPAFAAAVGLVRRFPVSVGVHLDLTEFVPDPPGIHAPGGVAERLWSMQIARVLDAGIAISHVDGHQHVHQRHLSTVASLCRRFGIARVRGMSAVRTDGAGGARSLVQRARAARFRARIRRAGLRTTEGFGSVTVLRGLRSGMSDFEAMAHPGNPHHAAYAEEVRWLLDGGLRTLPVTLVGWDEI